MLPALNKRKKLTGRFSPGQRLPQLHINGLKFVRNTNCRGIVQRFCRMPQSTIAPFRALDSCGGRAHILGGRVIQMASTSNILLNMPKQNQLMLIINIRDVLHQLLYTDVLATYQLKVLHVN